ncbi:MAG: hypothetical protein GOVbin1807_38 [Prokaryotic dsDNA virus sp.]|nr:MAG: hypothetical protein GOVbin1807_38 [Prokaryotic dsDNA virus sp.]|tara:strand:+ start:6626 stop:7216 length:591 start_codon:yes stop_codon:yes gene_type:complete
MSKKLLSEAQVRRFQSLASIKPLQEMGSYAMKRDEKENNEGLYQEEVVSEEEEKPMETMYEEEAEDEPAPAPEPEMDMADADGDEVDMTSDDLSAVADALDTLSSKLAPLLDAVDAPEGEDEAAEMPAMEPSADAGEEDEEEPAGAMDDILQEALKGIEYEPSQGEIVKAVALRVAKRLQEAKKAQAKLDKALGRK